MARDSLRAAVFYRDTHAGILARTDAGYEFRYDAAYVNRPGAQPISLSLPVRSEPYTSARLFPFFDGLLPEGWLLELTSAVARIDQDDTFRLLLHTGRDPVGAVSLRPLGEDEPD